MGGWCSECNWYCWLCRRMEILLSLTESTGWSWLLWMYQTNSTDSTRYQSSKFGLWSPVLKAKKLTINFTDLQCVVIINCLSQTVKAVICCLVCLTNNGWSGGKTRLFLVMLYRQHSWADLQVVIHHRFDPLTTQLKPCKALCTAQQSCSAFRGRTAAALIWLLIWGQMFSVMSRQDEYFAYIFWGYRFSLLSTRSSLQSLETHPTLSLIRAPLQTLAWYAVAALIKAFTSWLNRSPMTRHLSSMVARHINVS